jgi:hypothetical protein
MGSAAGPRDTCRGALPDVICELLHSSIELFEQSLTGRRMDCMVLA